MSSIYYPESWMQHPEVLRLQQRVRELEQENEQWKDKYRYACEEITRRREDAQVYYETQEWLFEERRAFNHLPFYKKMFFHFDF
jgi:hypothetical protein